MVACVMCLWKVSSLVRRNGGRVSRLGGGVGGGIVSVWSIVWFMEEYVSYTSIYFDRSGTKYADEKTEFNFSLLC